MTRVVIDIPAMTAAASRLSMIAGSIEEAGGAVRAGELPAMPAAMAARHGQGRDAIAQRAAAIGEPVAAIATELRRRAAAAQVAADDGAAGRTGRRVAAAVGGSAGTGGLAAPNAPGGAGGGEAVGAHETIRHHAARAVHEAAAGGHHGDGDLRAATHDGAGHAPSPPVPHDGASPQDWACWMASHAAHEGLPPSLPLALSLANSGLRNLEAHSNAVGFFGIPAGRDLAPAGFGLASTAQPDSAWWHANPDAQVAHVLRGLSASAPADVPTSPQGLAAWAAEAEPGSDPDAVATALSTARTLVARCRHGLGDPDGHAGAEHHDLLGIATHQLGVNESGGANVGPEVDRYLAAAGVAPGNPWCASFVTWAMRQSGHPMAGAGWASVAHWVSAAQAHADGLALVDPAHARPGDIVAYDWGGGTDFGADGHIGILASTVGADGSFAAVEGNAGDAVARMQRHLGEAHIVFIRGSGAGSAGTP